MITALTIDRTKAWTVEDYLLLGELTTPCQLINGELIMSPAPAPLHQRIVRKLYDAIKECNLNGEIFFAPIDLYIDSKNVFQPDLIYLSNHLSHLVTNRGIEGAPDMVAEIISPSNSYTDRNQKKKKYLDFGVGEYWIIDPANETLEIYTPTSGEDVPVVYLTGKSEVQSTVVKGLSINLKDIF